MALVTSADPRVVELSRQAVGDATDPWQKARNIARWVFKNLQDKKQAIESQLLALDVELQMRPALSLGCLCFILVGCPVGIWFSRSDYLSAFITCFLPIVFVYYPIILCGTGMAKEGKFSPYLSVWLANGVLLLASLLLYRKLTRH